MAFTITFHNEIKNLKLEEILPENAILLRNKIQLPKKNFRFTKIRSVYILERSLEFKDEDKVYTLQLPSKKEIGMITIMYCKIVALFDIAKIFSILIGETWWKVSTTFCGVNFETSNNYTIDIFRKKYKFLFGGVVVSISHEGDLYTLKISDGNKKKKFSSQKTGELRCYVQNLFLKDVLVFLRNIEGRVLFASPEKSLLFFVKKIISK